MNEKKKFVEPEVVKCKESLDKVTLCFNGYGDNGDNDNFHPWKWPKRPKRHHR